MRQSVIERKTNETDIHIAVDLDGAGTFKGETRCGFFDHMLAQIARHGMIDLTVKASGDLHVDAHHLVEDCGIALGQAFAQALGDKRGITRFGAACVPMDDALSRVVVDFSGRPYTVFNVAFPAQKIGYMDTEVLREFFIAFANNAAANVHVENLYGENAHHIAESCFKAFARAVRQAVSFDERAKDVLPSTKGAL